MTGAAIGIATGNPLAAFAVGVASHFVLDAVPHTDPGTWHFEDPYPFKPHAADMAVGLFDLFLALYLLLYLAGQAPLVAAAPLAGIVGAVIPDVISIAPLFYHPLAKFKPLERYHAFARRVHRTAKPSEWILGLVTQVIVIGGAVWYLLGS